MIRQCPANPQPCIVLPQCRQRYAETSMMQIDRILHYNILDPLGPEFMAPPVRTVPAATSLELPVEQTALKGKQSRYPGNSAPHVS
jgi:hypothetical protein